MKRSTTALLAAAALMLPVAALADTILPDPLHGLCAGCADNGTNTPLNGQTTFGFSSSPPNQTGDLTIDVLIPNNDAIPAGLGVTGSVTGSFNTHTGQWTSGDLAVDFLGETGASPSQPIGAYLPATDALDPGATGFFVLQVDAGTQTLGGTVWPTSDQFTLNEGLPLGSYVVGELVTSPGAAPIETANSAALLVNASAVPAPIAGAGLPGLIAGIVGLVALGRRRKNHQLAGGLAGA